MTFHGWLQIEVEVEVEVEVDGADYHLLQEEAISRVQSEVDLIDDTISIFDVRRRGNGMVVLGAHGVRNHRNEVAVELFRRIAKEFPHSFGLLHLWDDEHSEFDNCFRVYRYAHGDCLEMDDPHLSPCIPTIEAEYK